MSNILSQHPIRYQIDILNGKLYGVFVTLPSAVNLARASSVTGINISGTQPSSTYRYFAFCVNNSWGKLTSAGAFEPFTANSTDFFNIEANGNTAAELSALTDIPALAGKSFGVAIALAADDPDNAKPTCGMSFACVSNNQQLTAEEFSPVYSLGQDSQIISLSADTESSLGGTATVTAKITNSEGVASSWQALENFSGMKANSVQFRAEYKVQSVGTSSAKVNSASIIFTDGASIVSGIAEGDIITNTLDWYMPVKTCRLTIRHAPLEFSSINAYIAFRDSPMQAKSEQLGIGTGGRKTFQLSHTNGLRYDSLRLYYDNIRVYSDFEFNCQSGRVTCSAPEGVIITCTYEYGWDMEEWHEMERSSRLSYDSYDETEYRYTSGSEGKSVCALKIVLGMTSGSIVNERVGVSTGTAQSFKLSKRVNDGNISVSADGSVLSSKYWKLLEDPQFISVAAPAGKYIRASYDWISETPKVYQYAAVYSE